MDKYSIIQGWLMFLPEVDRQFFQIHGSKFKPDPFCYLSQASVKSITHTVFLFGIRKDTLDCLLTVRVQLLVFWGMPIILNDFHIVLPDMAFHDFLA